jgi:hypothetical protein
MRRRPRKDDRFVTSSIEIVVDAVDADGAAAFWKEALGYEFQSEKGAYTSLGPPEGDPRPRLVIQRGDVVTPGKTAVHSTPGGRPDAEVTRMRAQRRVAWRGQTDRGGSVDDDGRPHGTLFCRAGPQAGRSRVGGRMPALLPASTTGNALP